MSISRTLIDRIKSASNGKFEENSPLAGFTSYKIGGPARIRVIPETEKEITNVLEIIRQNNIEFFVLGKGTNLLIADKGFDGVILHLADNFSGIKKGDNKLIVKSGTSLIKVIREASSLGFAGIEQLAGIPGTVGGALRMNAGAFGQEIEAVTKKVTAINKNNEIEEIKRDQISFAYRSAPELENLVILNAEFSFNSEKIEILEKRVKEILEIRSKKQPLEYPSCGSVFKRPVGYYAGALIQESGLKGKSIGGAQISSKHAGFIVNTGSAKAQDVYALIKTIEDTVYEKFGVALQREVKLLGFNEEA